eukprot:GHVU01017891.1.p1 GENE.GHVU01017891.1~~GHVU01017891.1.p1  ORF type:complete len:139 (+),score=20.24 GHVU01017891.1:1109-1525(+)
MVQPTKADAAAGGGGGNFARRDLLLTIEKQMQDFWEDRKAYESDPPIGPNSSNKDVPKFFATFPYPYMNGRLHLGHAYSLSKAEFAARFHRTQGARTLFPLGLHCTGTQACGASLASRSARLSSQPVFPDAYFSAVMA